MEWGGFAAARLSIVRKEIGGALAWNRGHLPFKVSRMKQEKTFSWYMLQSNKIDPFFSTDRWFMSFLLPRYSPSMDLEQYIIFLTYVVCEPPSPTICQLSWPMEYVNLLHLLYVNYPDLWSLWTSFTHVYFVFIQLRNNMKETQTAISLGKNNLLCSFHKEFLSNIPSNNSMSFPEISLWHSFHKVSMYLPASSVFLVDICFLILSLVQDLPCFCKHFCCMLM